MQKVDPAVWYRIPGFNGYDYCFGTNQVRSWKVNKKYGGKILKKDANDCAWVLTSDADERVYVTTPQITKLIKSNPLQLGGPNMNPRAHLARAKGYRQTAKGNFSEEKNITPNFDIFVVKES
jgi:hypothetical protein